MTEEQLCAPLVALCDELAAAMVEKGVVAPSVSIEIASGGVVHVSIRGQNCAPEGYKYFYDFDPIADARAFIKAMPDPAIRAVQNHMARVSRDIDLARADGIDDAYIAPLAAVKAAMAENLLAAPVAS